MSDTIETPHDVGRLKRRGDFLRAAGGGRIHRGALSLQAAPGPGPGVRIGFTLTRKVGNAVVRNRARRRLKEAVRLSPDLPVKADHDYVIVGRIGAVRLPFEALKRELSGAIRAIHEPARQRSRDARPKRTRPEP